MGKACGTHGREICKTLTGKPEGKRPFRRPRRRWENNIRMDLREIRWEGVVRMHLPQVRDKWWWGGVL
jgi:hypothetical protein